MSHSSDEDWIEVSDAETGTGKGKRDLTDLAKRYTHPTGRNHATLANTGKSGLTPIPPYPENRPLPSQTERERIAQLEAYQMWRFLSFRIQNLVEMEAFAPSYKSDLALYEQFRQGSAANFKGLGANVPVHPLFSRNKWAKACFKSRPWYLLPGGKSGHWQAHNDHVWKILEPCLRLASAFLSSAHALSWFEALFAGDYSPIETNILDEWKGGKLLQFKPRCPRPKNLEKIVKDGLDDVAGRIIWSLTSAFEDANTGKPRDTYTCGRTTGSSPTEPFYIHLAFEELLPLLGEGHTMAERQVDVVRVAITVLHETCHAIWGIISEKHQKTSGIDHEPYFEGQPLTELGFSMEEAVFGGYGRELTTLIGGLGGDSDFQWMGSGLSSAAWLQSSWMSNHQHIDYGRPGRGTPPAIPPFPATWGTNAEDYFPIPISYFEELNAVDFWTHVRKYGTAATKMPKTEGRRIVLAEKGTFVSEVPPDLLPVIDINAPDDMTAPKIEQMRVQRAKRIKNALDLALARRQAIQEKLPPIFLANRRLWFDPPGLGSPFEASVLPSCPRYNEISQYLLKNRMQGKLCLDTMRFNIPENTLLNYILDLEGLVVSPEEWRAFLRVSDSKQGEYFSWKPDGKGVIMWWTPAMGAKDRILPNPRPGYQDPGADIVNLFTKMCFLEGWWLGYAPDFDVRDLISKMGEVVGRNFAGQELAKAQKILNPLTISSLINVHDSVVPNGFWCWGPSRVVRRLDANWPRAAAQP